MGGETRRVINIDSGRRSPGTVRRRTAGPPPDNSFFISSRVKLGSNPLENPYRQHAFFHAAVRRLTSALTVAPFRLLRETSSGSSTSGTALRDRRDAWNELTKTKPRLKSEIFDIFHSRGDKVRKRLARDFVSTIRTVAPDAPFNLVAKAVGVEVVEEGPWWELFRDVNPELTRSQLWDATTVYLETDGESFWVMLKGNSKWSPPADPVPASQEADYVPTEIWPYGKRGWSPVRDPKKKTLSGWKFDRRDVTGTDKAITFKTDQIGHFKFFDPNNPTRGLAPAEALRIELLQDHNAARYNLGFFERGAQLPWVLIFSEKLGEGDKEDIEDQLLRDYGGVENTWRPAVFDGGGEIKSVGTSQRDMDYFTLRQWVRDETLAVIGTPKTEMGIFQDANRASALVSKRVFWDNTLLPLMRYYEDNIDSFLFAPVTDGGLFGAFDTSMVEALREDLADKAKVAEVLWKMGFTANEINERVDLGFEPQEWRDKGWVNQNIIPVDTAISGDEPDEPEGDDDDEDGDMTGGDDDGGGGDGNEPQDGDEPEAEPDDSEPSDDGEGQAFPMTRQFDEDDLEAVLLVTTQAERVQRIVDTVRGQIITSLQKGVEAGLTREELIQAIREKFNFVTGASNISSKATTETSQMSNIARSREMRRRGVPINVWVTAGDERVRDEHQDLDGVEGEPGFNFATVLTGRVGVVLEFPLDPRAPAELVVNCRCVLLPRRAPRTRLSLEEKDEKWERYVTRVLDPGEAALRDAVKTIFWRIRGAQLKLIEEADLETVTPNSLAFKVDEFKADLTTSTLPIYKDIYSASVEELEEELAELELLEPGT